MIPLLEASVENRHGDFATLEGAVVGTFVMLELRVKTLDRLGLDGGDAMRRHPLGGVVVEFRYLSIRAVVLGGKSGFPLFSFLYL